MAVRSKESDSQAGAAQTREKILRAAAQAFADKGFSGATFRDVGDAAGVSFQLIRHHFGTKEQLWEAVVELLCTEAQDYGLEHENSIVALPLDQQLREQVRSLVIYLVEHPELNRIVMREAMKGSERYRRVYPLAIERFQKLMASFLGRLQAANVIRRDIPLEDLIFVFEGALIYRVIAPLSSEIYAGKPVNSPEVIEAHVDAVTRLLLV